MSTYLLYENLLNQRVPVRYRDVLSNSTIFRFRSRSASWNIRKQEEICGLIRTGRLDPSPDGRMAS